MWQVIGHEHAVRLLRNSIQTGHVSHAYLFSGPRQVGKSTLAREFARALNCESADSPCGTCRSCAKIAASTHPDVQFVDLEEGSKNISIDAVRKLQEGVALKPFEGRTKVYVIEEVERLSDAASNSLLKTLEEPPPSVVLVLTTLDASALLPTVVSRCQQLELRPVPSAVVETTLVERGLDRDRARLVAALARGRIGWALQLLAGGGGAIERRAELLERLAGLAGASRVERFAYAGELANLYGRDPDSARAVLDSWQSWWRDLLLCRIGLCDLAVNLDFRERLTAESGWYPVDSLGNTVRSIQRTVTLLGQNVNPRLALESLMLRVPIPDVSHQLSVTGSD